MNRFIFALLFFFWAWSGIPAQAQECVFTDKTIDLPVKVKTKGKKPPVVRWDQVDRILSDIEKALADDAGCRLRFGEIFRISREEVYFPITNNLLRIVPEAELKGLQVFSVDGYPLGTYENRVVFERSGGGYALNAYKLHYFQFRDVRGEMQSSGNRHLIDIESGDPIFVFRWDEIKDRVAVGRTAESRIGDRDGSSGDAP